MTDEPLVGRFEYLGEWFLDGHEDDKLIGALTLDAGASELTLVGAFKNAQPTASYRILGRTTDGVGFTLLDAYLARADATPRSAS